MDIGHVGGSQAFPDLVSTAPGVQAHRDLSFQIATEKERAGNSPGRSPIRGRNFQFDHLGLNGGRIRANNRGVVFHPEGWSSPTRSGGFWFLLS